MKNVLTLNIKFKFDKNGNQNRSYCREDKAKCY